MNKKRRGQAPLPVKPFAVLNPLSLWAQHHKRLVEPGRPNAVLMLQFEKTAQVPVSSPANVITCLTKVFALIGFEI